MDGVHGSLYNRIGLGGLFYCVSRRDVAGSWLRTYSETNEKKIFLHMTNGGKEKNKPTITIRRKEQ